MNAYYHINLIYIIYNDVRALTIIKRHLKKNKLNFHSRFKNYNSQYKNYKEQFKNYNSQFKNDMH